MQLPGCQAADCSTRDCGPIYLGDGPPIGCSTIKALQEAYGRTPATSKEAV